MAEAINYRSPYSNIQTTLWRKWSLKKVHPLKWTPYIRKARGGVEFSSLGLAMEFVHFKLEKGAWEFDG